MFVGDRSSLFAALREASEPASRWPCRGSNLPLEGRLRLILARLSSAWPNVHRTPRWRDDQVDNPDTWNVKISVVPGQDPKWMSKIAFENHGLVGLDVKSHQEDTSYPYPVITEGNDAQDRYCCSVNANPKPPDVWLLSCGPFAFLCKDGRMVTRTPSLFVRGLLRSQSSAAMATKSTQGYLATLRGSLYPHTLDVRIYTSCSIPTQLSNLILPSDKADKVHLSSIMFRMQRAVGGSWTEYHKSDAILCHLISEQMSSLRLPNVRTCPFCKSNHGTPPTLRHGVP